MRKVFSIVVLFFIFHKGNAQTGIGTTTPVNKFQVETIVAAPLTSGSSFNGNLRLSATGVNQVLDFGLSTTYAWLQSRDKSNYGINYNLLLNPNGGNVGIGTTSPTAKLNIVGGGIKLFNGFVNNNTSRPSITTTSIGGYEIRGVGGSGASTQNDGGDDGFLRLSAGGGTSTNYQSYIDLSGYSAQADMNRNIVFGVAGAEKMRLNESGSLGIGTSNPTTNLHIENGNTFGTSPSSTSSPSLYIYNNNNSSSAANATALIRTNGTNGGKPYLSFDINGVSGYSMGINNPNNFQFILNTTWNFSTSSADTNALIINRYGTNRVIIPNSSGGYLSDWPGGWGGGLATYDISCGAIYANGYVTRSDNRLKNTILTIENDVVSKYLKLRPVTYYWNQDQPRDPKLQFGLIAQEVEPLFPEMVNTATDEMQTKSVNYQALHALSIKVIQEQQKQIEELQQKQAALEQRLLLLESKKE